VTLEALWELSERHHRQWIKIQEMDQLRWNDFPWPTMKALSTPDEMTYTAVEVYLFYPYRVKYYNIGLLRDRIRLLATKWHPGHFDDLFLSRVMQEDKTMVTRMYRFLMRIFSDVLTLSNSFLFKEVWWPRKYTQVMLEATARAESNLYQAEAEARRKSEAERMEADAKHAKKLRSWGEYIEAEKVAGTGTESESGDSYSKQTGERKRRFEGGDGRENAAGSSKSAKRVQREEGSTRKIEETWFGYPWRSSQRTRDDDSSSYSHRHSRNILSVDILPIVERLRYAFGDISEYKRLLHRRGPEAQMLLDLLQTVGLTSLRIFSY
jgi:hypothetical protein